jgi:SpoIIAA-like
MIDQLQNFPENVVAFACHGHVTRENYMDTLVPVVEKALADHDKVRLYYEIGPEFKNIDLDAVWTDFATGVEHWTRWERIAIVTDVDWIRNTMWAFGFLIPGEVRLFSMSHKSAAREWIVSA